MLQVRLLGQFDVRADGKRVFIPSRAGQSLFAFLILSAGTAHRREELAGQLWPDTLEDNARANLRRELWRIRKALSDQQSTASEYLLTEELTITFDAQSQYWLDVAQLEWNLLPEDSLDARLDQVSLYQGALLPGFYDDWAVLERERLQALFEDKMQQLLEGLVAEQRWTTVLEWGEKWLALGNTPEPAYRALMLAHGACGDMAKVAALYQRCVEALRNELDVEPSGETRALYEQLAGKAEGARRKDELAAMSPSSFIWSHPDGRDHPGPHPSSLIPHPSTFILQPSTKLTPAHNLPPQPKSFVGRTHELAELERYLRDPACRLVTVLGAGGIGKTRLALEAARQNLAAFPDGVYFVPLQPLASSELVVPAIARALEFSFSGQTNPTLQLAAYLREVKPQSLLLLDNLEHVLGSAGALEEILIHAPPVKLLVSSRERLRLEWEWLLELGGLDVPADEEDAHAEEYAAVQLFLERARRLYPRFSFAQEGRAVTHVCRLVQGHPLAIELAVAWVRTLPCAEIAQRIQQNLDTLALPQTVRPDQHRSIAATFEHSYALLSTQEQRVFKQLAVFEGGFERDAAERVAGATLNALSGLVDKSLAQRDAAGRYEMHELLRRYAGQKLQADELEAAAVGQRMFRYYLELAQMHREDHAALELEWNNLNAGLRLAHQYHDWQVVMDHVAALGKAWEVRARFTDARQGYRLACDAAQARGDAHALATYLREWGKASIEQGDYREAKGHLERVSNFARRWRMLAAWQTLCTFWRGFQSRAQTMTKRMDSSRRADESGKSAATDWGLPKFFTSKHLSNMKP